MDCAPFFLNSIQYNNKLVLCGSGQSFLLLGRSSGPWDEMGSSRLKGETSTFIWAEAMIQNVAVNEQQNTFPETHS